MYKRLPIVYKISLILLLIWFVLGSFTFFIHKWIIFPAFSDIEYREARKNGERVVRAIDREITVLESLCKDWAFWDDTYEFADTPDPGYIQSNINPITYDTNELNLLYITGPKGKVLWGKAYDLTRKAYVHIHGMPEVQLEASHPMAINLAADKPAADQGLSGMIKTPAGFMIFSTQPILTSDNTGPPRGMMIMGKLMDEAWIKRLADQTHLDIELIDLFAGSSEKHNGLERAQTQLTEKLSFSIHELENSMLNIYSPLFDVQETRILMLKVRVKGEILERGKQTLTFALNSSVIALVAILVMMFLVITKAIVSPISTLSDHIHAISKTGDLSSRLSIDNPDDEIGSLGKQYNEMLDQLEKKTELLNQLATTDPLTGLHNRRHAMEFLEKGLALAQRYGQPLAVILMDIDYFKKVNDTFGHNVGDEVLVRFSALLRSNLRSTDMAARFGGEEFLLILTNQNLETARVVGEKLRTRIEQSTWAQKGLKVTVSGGICDDTGLDTSGMLAAADKKLYAAKKQGRNRVL